VRIWRDLCFVTRKTEKMVN